MESIISGYEYDIFISYRQKDNKGDRWVSEFVEALKTELESTFKEEVSVYFDINPHDGLLETHDVNASLKDKLKCLVFIPIISRTYCDPKSFAWEHEFRAFVEEASKDQYGLKVKLPSGNIANRVLPVRIHDLDVEDIRLCESLLGGVLRGVEFIYKSPGVNRPLCAMEDKPHDNLNNTIYRDQINKIANAIKEIVSGLIVGEVVAAKEKEASQLPWEEARKRGKTIPEEKRPGFKKSKLFYYIISVVLVLVLLGVYVYPKIFIRDTLEKLRSSKEKISVAVMPFQNLTNDTIWNAWQEGIQTNLITSLGNTGELIVRKKDNILSLLKSQGLVEYAAISPSLAGKISNTLEADIFIYGSIQHAGSTVRLNAQLIDTKAEEVLKPFEINGPYNEKIIFDLTDSLRKQITDFLIISKLMKENPGMQHNFTPPKSSDALRYLLNGGNAANRGDIDEARNWYLKSLAADSGFFSASFALENTYGGTEQSYKWLIKNFERRDRMSLPDRLYASWAYEFSFGPPNEQIKYLKQLQELDDQDPFNPYMLGFTYNRMDQFDKAIPELEKALEIVRKWGKDYLKDQSAFFELGLAYHKTGQYKKEEKLYKESEMYDADYRPITYRRAILSLTEKDTSATKEYIAKHLTILKANSTSEADINKDLAIIYWHVDMPDKAEGYFRKMLSLEPENPGRLNDFADFLIDNKRNLNEVSELMDKAMKLAPNKVDYYNYLNTKGWVLYKQGKNKEALEMLQKCWDEAPFKLYSIRSHYEEVKKAVAGQK
jgi:tetratricopeptide (TPR) repeat protein